MNPVIELIKNHRSIRNYQSKPIDDSILDEILFAGTRCASSGNMQFYSMVVTKDEGIRKKLYHAHGEQEMILQAPVLITFCADQKRIHQWMEANGANYAGDNLIGAVRGIVDVCLMAQNVVLAAESLGLGTCYMGSTLKGANRIIEILELPKMVMPVTSIVLGYPNEERDLVGRLDMEAIVHKERYNKKSNQEVNQYYIPREEASIERLLARQDIRDQIGDQKVENAAQAYASTKFKASKLEKWSKTYTEVMRTQFDVEL